MKKSDKILLTLVITASCFSLFYTFYKTVIKGDFDIVNIEPPNNSAQE